MLLLDFHLQPDLEPISLDLYLEDLNLYLEDLKQALVMGLDLYLDPEGMLQSKLARSAASGPWECRFTSMEL